MMKSNMATKPTRQKSLQTLAERSWTLLLSITLVGVILILVAGIFLGRWFSIGFSYTPIVGEYPFTRDRLDDIVFSFEEREGQYGALRGAPVTVVDPAQ